MKILVVDDDHDIVELLSIYIRNEGYEAIAATSGTAALQKLEQNPDIDLMILDIMMPDISGIEVLEKVRATSQIPIIIVSAKTSDLDKIKGLISADEDYVGMARIKSLLRRTHAGEENIPNQLTIGPLTINKKSHEVVTASGQKVQLTALEFGILYLLASHPNQVFSADEIFERVWKQESIISAKTVMVHVSHLRDKLEAATNGEKVIETVWGVGYKVEA